MESEQTQVSLLKQFTRNLIINSNPELKELMEEKKELKTIQEKDIQKLEDLEKSSGKQLPPSTEHEKRFPIKKIPSPERGVQPKAPPLQREMQQPPKTIKQTPEIPASHPINEYKPQPEKLPEKFDLGKINPLIHDPNVTVIECPGPLSKIMVKARGAKKVTGTTLTANEINEIIEKFSKQAKIPIISGLFKAAVGNLIITAVVSKESGSNFIITKITQQFIIEQQQQGFSPQRNFPTSNFQKINPRTQMKGRTKEI